MKQHSIYICGQQAAEKGHTRRAARVVESEGGPALCDNPSK